ncbi:hypothetical protein [Kineococcus xinjiangensis]|nr:hypothetical protein [Kineococcus xinjiangensis]
MKRTLALVPAAGLLALAAAGPATAATGDTYQAQLSSMNKSGASGTAQVTVLDGNRLRVQINSRGFLPGQPHAAHIHFAPEASHSCPTAAADTDGNGFISTPEGIPAYGEINLSLTTEGDVSPAAALAVENFPTADDGTISYDRTFDIPSTLDPANLGDAVIVQHGIDVNGNGMYDMEAPIGASPLNPQLPAEATHPAACGALNMMPAGGAATGAGSTAGSLDTGLLAGGALAMAAGGVLLLRRRTAGEQ